MGECLFPGPGISRDQAHGAPQRVIAGTLPTSCLPRRIICLLQDRAYRARREGSGHGWCFYFGRVL